jgi:hypothetical protein
VLNNQAYTGRCIALKGEAMDTPNAPASIPVNEAASPFDCIISQSDGVGVQGPEDHRMYSSNASRNVSKI